MPQVRRQAITTTASHSPHQYHRHNISSAGFWELGFRERDDTFAELRAEDGLTWHQPFNSPFPHQETGFWAVTKHADVKFVSMNSDLFVSSEGISIEPMPAEIQRATAFFLTMDPPEHTRYRRLISSAFTPRQVRKIERQIRDNAREIVDDLLRALDGGAEVDFVAECACKLPMHTISDMIGIDRADRDTVLVAAEALSGAGDDDYTASEDKAIHMMTQFGGVCCRKR